MSEMKPKAKEAWLKALRSTRFRQGTSQLCYVHQGDKLERHCCLGVLCELYIEDTGDHIKTVEGVSDRHFDRHPCVLPAKVMEWSGLHSEYGSIPGRSEGLATLNDYGKSFAELADLIEAEL